MRKFRLFIATLLILCVFFNGVLIQGVHASSGNTWLSLIEVNKGIIHVKYDVKSNVMTKLLITKGKEQYTYSLTTQGEVFPLQLGNGNYNVSIVEQTNGNKYKVVQKDTVTLNMNDTKKVYLNSIQIVDWNSTDNAIKMAKKLTNNLTTDSAKVKAIYSYVINNIKYDNKLAANVPLDYIPQIEATFSSKKDICYGYASLFAAMLRSVNIPTKLVMGTSKYVDTYHAWNEVYLNNKWVTIDTTVDAGWKGTTTAFTMIKDSSKYVTTKQY